METAKIFEDRQGQIVRLPKKFRFISEEVFVQRLGDAVILIPKEAYWQTFLKGIDGFSDDFSEKCGCLERSTERDNL